MVHGAPPLCKPLRRQSVAAHAQCTRLPCRVSPARARCAAQSYRALRAQHEPGGRGCGSPPFFAFDSRESAESSRSQLPAALACALRFLYTVYLANTVKTRPRCQPELLNHGSRPCFRAQQQLQPRERQALKGMLEGRLGGSRGKVQPGGQNIATRLLRRDWSDSPPQSLFDGWGSGSQRSRRQAPPAAQRRI